MQKYKHKRNHPKGGEGMKQSNLLTFNTNPNDASSLLARANRQISQAFLNTRDKCALMAIICPLQIDNFDLSQDKSVHFLKKIVLNACHRRKIAA
jgi:hypothetical protein